MFRCISLGVVVLLGACSTTEYTSSSTAPARSPFTGEVQVLDVMPPSGSYERLGVVIARGADITSDRTLRRNLLKEAGQIGANAVILQGPIQNSFSSDGQTERRLAAWAIWLKP